MANRERITCAIGDVHGQIRKLENVLKRCDELSGLAETQYILVGDYIDRGPDSRAVVELLISMQRSLGSRVVCLRGNHEAVMVAAAADRLHSLPGNVTLDQWLGENGGGAATLASYGIELARDVPPEILAWMAALPPHHDDGQRFFVHAGVHPDRPLEEQREHDLLWIREPFLSHVGQFGRLVVHGHTPTPNRLPDLRPNRLNLDTGAGYDGPVTAAIFSAGEIRPIILLSDVGEIRLTN